MNLSDEIRKQIEKNKDLKLAVGEINNHLSILENLVRKDIMEQVDEAYQKGLEEGKKAFDLLDAGRDSEYQRGLNDAWEAVRKIVLNPDKGGASLQDLYAIFGNNASNASMLHICRSYSAYEVIEKFKAYEEKQKADDEIKVGDEVIYNGTTKCVVVTPETDEKYASLFDCNGIHYSADHRECKKTGRHFDIKGILEAMKHD